MSAGRNLASPLARAVQARTRLHAGFNRVCARPQSRVHNTETSKAHTPSVDPLASLKKKSTGDDRLASIAVDKARRLCERQVSCVRTEEQMATNLARSRRTLRRYTLRHIQKRKVSDYTAFPKQLVVDMDKQTSRSARQQTTPSRARTRSSLDRQSAYTRADTFPHRAARLGSEPPS